MSKAFLSLHMIVKNEARSIERVLAKAAPWVDTWDIVDTGSTDGTPELIEKAMSGIPGRLHREPFIPFEDSGIIDFGATRQRSLELALENAEWTFWLSGDEYLDGGENIRSFCEAHQTDEPLVYSTTAYYDKLATSRPFLFRQGCGARWSDPIHEWIFGARSGAALPKEVFILHTGAEHGPRAARYARDLAILQRLRARSPKSERYAFYYAQTLECLDLHAEAAKAYAHRVAMGGWDEEVYSAAWIGARELASSGAPWSDAMARFLDAHQRRPHRAEALFEIAKHYADRDQHALAFLFANTAASLPIPTQDSHFIQTDVYTRKALELVAIHAFYCGQREAGLAAAKRLLALDPENVLYHSNLAHYLGRRTVKIGRATLTLRTDKFGDEQIFSEIFQNDDYGLKKMDLPEHACVIDAGCQVGVFTAALIDRFPTARVVGVELDQENFNLATQNLSAIGVRHARVIHGALVGETVPNGYVPAGHNTGGHTVAFSSCDGIKPLHNPVTLAEVAACFEGRRIDLLKMDIESAEHGVLALAAKDGTLDRIDRIVMEWHAWREGETKESLRSLLEAAGFDVDAIDGRCTNQGTISAKRPAAQARDGRMAAASAINDL